MTPIFLQKAEELRDSWDEMVPEASIKHSPFALQQDSVAPTKSEASAAEAVLDVSLWASRATFDVIGLAGFDYHFNSLEDESEAVCLAYRRMFNAVDKGPGLKGLLRIYFPLIEKVFVSKTFSSPQAYIC